MTISISAPYQPRHVAPLDLMADDRWRLKAYWMTVDGSEPDDAVIQAAADGVLDLLRDEDGYGVGFVIVHRGEIAEWVVLGWWTDEDILRRRVLVHEDGALRDRSEEHFMACVWELSVIDWERKAWINTVLRHPDDARPERYLAAAYPSEFC